MVGEASGRMQKADCRDEIALPAAMLAWLKPGFPRIHTSLTLTIRPETLGNIEFNCIFTCHLVHSVV